MLRFPSRRLYQNSIVNHVRESDNNHNIFFWLGLNYCFLFLFLQSRGIVLNAHGIQPIPLQRLPRGVIWGDSEVAMSPVLLSVLCKAFVLQMEKQPRLTGNYDRIVSKPHRASCVLLKCVFWWLRLRSVYAYVCLWATKQRSSSQDTHWRIRDPEGRRGCRVYPECGKYLLMWNHLQSSGPS